jgi:hypothetical protein
MNQLFIVIPLFYIEIKTIIQIEMMINRIGAGALKISMLA